MATTHSNPEKDTDDVPNADARTAKACVFCGETDDMVDEHSFQSEDWPSIAFHNVCAPPMHELYEWARERFDG